MPRTKRKKVKVFSRDGYRLMIAKYDTRCANCQVWIKEGTRIKWKKDGERTIVMHDYCSRPT